MYRDARLLVMNERRMDALEEKCNGTVFLPSHIAGSSSAIVGGCQSSMVRVEHAACPHIRCRYSGFTYVSRYVARARGTATCYPLTDCSEQKRGGLVLHLVRALNRNEQRLFLRVFFLSWVFILQRLLLHVLFAMAGGVVLSVGNLSTQYAWAYVGLSVTEVISSSMVVVIGK
jgi:hypothetical protein